MCSTGRPAFHWIGRWCRSANMRDTGYCQNCEDDPRWRRNESCLCHPRRTSGMGYSTFAVEPVANIDSCLAFILRDHVIRLMMEAAIEIEYAPVRQTKQIGIGIVVAGVLGVGTGRFNAQRGTPRERIVGFGDAVIHLSLGGMLRVHRDVSAVGPHKEGGSIVIILLEMRMQ